MSLSKVVDIFKNECTYQKINDIMGDLDKKNDAFHNIDKIIFRNNLSHLNSIKLLVTYLQF